jgi:hypothetical protein
VQLIQLLAFLTAAGTCWTAADLYFKLHFYWPCFQVPCWPSSTISRKCHPMAPISLSRASLLLVLVVACAAYTAAGGCQERARQELQEVHMPSHRADGWACCTHLLA